VLNLFARKLLNKLLTTWIKGCLGYCLLLTAFFLHPPTLKIGFSGKGGAQHVSLLNFHVEFTVRKDFVLLNPLWNVPVLKNQIDFWRETFVHQIPMQPH
jgi:hypothetical protein